MKYQAVMFDLDGTLLDTLDDIANSVNRSLRVLGYPGHRASTYKLLIGNGRDVLAARSLPPAHRDSLTVDKLLGLINEDYIRHWADSTVTFPGVPQLLDTLMARGLRLAILSNKPDEFTQLIVKKLLPKWQFEIVAGAVPDLPVKPDPQAALQICEKLGVPPAQVLYVGDSDVDMRMAAAAKMCAVGALWGFRTAEELRANGAEVLVGHPSEILKLL
jgi:phosphoglycolate phosphatase